MTFQAATPRVAHGPGSHTPQPASARPTIHPKLSTTRAPPRSQASRGVMRSLHIGPRDLATPASEGYHLPWLVSAPPHEVADDSLGHPDSCNERLRMGDGVIWVCYGRYVVAHVRRQNKVTHGECL